MIYLFHINLSTNLECSMAKVNVNKETDVKIVKHYIKDLSFENPQTINENNATNNNDNNIVTNISFVYEPFENKFFSVVMKYTCECSSKIIDKKLFVLEIDYFGFFKILNDKQYDQAKLTIKGAKLILPFMKSIIEDISVKGGSVPISLENIDFNLIKN